MRIIGGTLGGRRIDAPPGRTTRPTTDRVREAWISAVLPRLEDADVLDLFAGSGALGIEALSRGAATATFVENGSAALRTLRANLRALDLAPDRAVVVRGDVFRALDDLAGRRFAVAFADPPYASGAASRLAERFRERPFADLLSIEHGRAEAIPEGADLRQRRYGDTILSFLTSPDESH